MLLTSIPPEYRRKLTAVLPAASVIDGAFVPAPGTYVGRTAPETSKLQGYLRKLEAERDSLRKHPAFQAP